MPELKASFYLDSLLSRKEEDASSKEEFEREEEEEKYLYKVGMSLPKMMNGRPASFSRKKLEKWAFCRRNNFLFGNVCTWEIRVRVYRSNT